MAVEKPEVDHEVESKIYKWLIILDVAIKGGIIETTERTKKD